MCVPWLGRGSRPLLSRSVRSQHVAASSYGLKVAGKARKRLDLAAQPRHLDVDGPAVARGAGLPAQLLTAERRARALGECGQQIGFHGGEPHLLRPAPQEAAVDVEAVRTEA